MTSTIVNQASNRPKTSGWTIAKKTLYSQLAETYHLPPKDSRGVSRKYLEKVQEGTAFRVETIELNKFLAELKPKQRYKAQFTCRYQVYSRVDRLLSELGKPGLGFEEGLIPKGDWLYRVARFIDPWNVCSVFEASLKAVPADEVDSFKIELGKRAVEHRLLISVGLDEAKDVKAAIKELELSHQRFRSRKAELDNLCAYGRRLTDQVEAEKREMTNKLASASLLVYRRGEKLDGEESLTRVDPRREDVYKM